MRKTLAQTLLAAFCAILAHAPLEGGGVMLIGMRNAMLEGGGVSAKSYIQDGLIAMWDGIENAGWGVHDPNATVWKDLIGERDFANVYAFRTNALTLNPSSVSANASWIIPYDQIVCMEVVLQLDSIDAHRVLINIGTGYHYSWATVGKRGVYMRLEDGGALKLNSLSLTESRTYALRYSPFSRVSISQNFDGADNVVDGFWVNGEIVTTINTYAAGVGALPKATINKGSGNIHSIRLYNRALTAAEVAANYAVDKTRFDMPWQVIL